MLMRVERITKEFRVEGGTLKVLDDVDFSVDEGVFLSIVGPSGCGKSTLLKIMGGIERPTSGRIIFKGREIKSPDPKISMVFQHFALIPWLTVWEQVELPLKARGIDKRRREKLVKKWLKKVGLYEFMDALPKELSGGMKQRVGIARALAVEPDLLLMDEPFSALDELTADSLREEILELWKSETQVKSVVMVTHNVEEAVYMSDYVVVLSRRPSKILGIVEIDLRRPRDTRSSEFYNKMDEVYSVLSG